MNRTANRPKSKWRIDGTQNPFRDGNGRVARLFSGLYLARIGINRRNLWSLSRGFSRNKKAYMFNLWTADSPEEPDEGDHFFSDDLLADFCEFFFQTCLDQIRFIGNDLVEEGLLESESHRAPLTIGLPIHALPYYFPDLYEPSVIGEEYPRI